MTNIFISILIPIRDRTFTSIKNCLNSLLNQTNKSFEILIVNYGSKNKLTVEIEKFIKDWPEIKYIYVTSEGLLFNKSHALNIALRSATGNYFMVCDSDLIVNKFFIDRVIKIIKPDNFYNYKCYKLPQGQKLDGILNKLKNKKLSAETGVGLIIAPIKFINLINGYDEYYRLWGLEDIDVFERLKKLGLKHNWLNEKEFLTYHQWHEHSGRLLPRGWYSTMHNYYKMNYNNKQNKATIIGRQISLSQRPVLKFVDSNSSKICRYHFNNKYNILSMIFEFIQAFDSLAYDECIYVYDNRPKTPLKIKILEYLFNSDIKINRKRIMKEINTSFNEVYDFIFYFILNHHNVQDYCLRYDESEIHFWAMKR